MWILGDSLLKSTKDILIGLKTDYINNPSKPWLYMHDHYDVITHYDEAQPNENFLLQIRNSMAHLMKFHYKLPSKILLLLNNTILDDPAFAITQLAPMLKWLFAEIETMITKRRGELPVKCLKDGEPAVYMIKMLPRGISNIDEQGNLFKSIRRRINGEIPDILSRFKYGFINACEITSASAIFFDCSGKNLAPAGAVHFWESVSQVIKEIDIDKTRKQPQYSQNTSKANQTPESWKTNHQDTTSRRHNSPRGSTPNHYRRGGHTGYQDRRHTYSYDYDRYHFNANRKY